MVCVRVCVRIVELFVLFILLFTFCDSSQADAKAKEEADRVAEEERKKKEVSALFFMHKQTTRIKVAEHNFL